MKHAWILIAITANLGPSPPIDGPQSIVQGNDPAQFELVGLGPDSITIHEGEVQLTGKPLGYFATRKDYGDYILSFEYRYDRPEALKSEAEFRGNSGLLVHLTRPHKVWPSCVQVQLAQADPGSIFAMGESVVDGKVAGDAQKKAIRPVGQWNRLDVTCRGGTISSVLNGVEVARGEQARPSRGAIAWQSEGKPIRFRSIRIQALP